MLAVGEDIIALLLLPKFINLIEIEYQFIFNRFNNVLIGIILLIISDKMNNLLLLQSMNILYEIRLQGNDDRVFMASNLIRLN
jgi:hypothetical protein